MIANFICCFIFIQCIFSIRRPYRGWTEMDRFYCMDMGVFMYNNNLYVICDCGIYIVFIHLFFTWRKVNIISLSFCFCFCQMTCYFVPILFLFLKKKTHTYNVVRADIITTLKYKNRTCVESISIGVCVFQFQL